jgi:hypothetical protein
MRKHNKQDKDILAFRVMALIFLFAISPESHASIVDYLTQQATTFKIGMVALSAVWVLCCIIWAGMQLAYSRMTGTHGKTFGEYIQDLMLVMFIGLVPAAAAAIWQAASSFSG